MDTSIYVIHIIFLIAENVERSVPITHQWEFYWDIASPIRERRNDERGHRMPPPFHFIHTARRAPNRSGLIGS